MEMLQRFFNAIRGIGESSTEREIIKKKKIKGKVVLMKKNVLDLNDFNASILDGVHELLGQGVSLQLISAFNGDPAKGLEGKRGKKAYLEEWLTQASHLKDGESAFKVTFDWEEDIGVPGAFIIENNHHSQFYLCTLTLEDVPEHGRVHFVCDSWVYPTEKYNYDRVFFTNQTHLPSETPMPLRKYREQELLNLRGDGTGERKEWDRVYDYAYYNDLGNPDRGSKHVRPILGGSVKYPYPRRGRTGREPTKTDPNIESRLPIVMTLKVYVPRDERFGHLKMSDFLGTTIKSVVQFLVPELQALFDKTINDFDTVEDVHELFEGGIKLPQGPLLDKLNEHIPFQLLKELVRTDSEQYFLKFPMPKLIQDSKSAWRTDEEFARQMLAGVNPVVIRRLQEFPPKSKLNPDVYGNQNSSMTREHIDNNLNGLTIEEAIVNNKLFILDHHDTLMPYIRRINTTTSKTYATRTLLFLKDDGTLKPLAIELSLPHPNGDIFGVNSKVYTPVEHGVEGSIWQLAKAYVGVNDSGVHELISHWLHTHAVIEPFIIATNRQLSSLHPVYKLLHPHFRDTMNINALARQILINAGGIIETTFFPAKYAMELSAAAYKDWVFPDQALPADLIKRGMAVEDSESSYGLRLIIEDYPYAVDGLEIWSATETWVREYCSFYYKTDDMVQNDTELQSWWNELVNEGHGDKKDEPWWPKMHSLNDLVDICTITIWIASALHAAVNFGQYTYAGYILNRPTMSRKFMPQPGTPEYKELESHPEKAVLKTITAQFQTILVLAILEILSKHASDEVYLGQRRTPQWTADEEPLEAFEKFGKKLGDIENKIVTMNKDKKMKNRVGSVNIPYMLLHPTSEGGLTGKGIPNSVSI